jgi:Ca2+-binding EF-hand superfamily protein
MKTVLIAATAALAGTAALAQPAAPVAPVAPAAPVRPMADHVMTRTEVVEMVRDHFGRFDTDKDGSITSEEMSAFGRMAERKLPDGAQPRVMIHEGPMGDPAAAFDRLDANKDGMISRQEFAAHAQVREERRVVVHGGPDDAPGMPATEPMHQMGMRMHVRMFEMADANRDGRVSLQEMTDAALRHFDMADANHDGRITPDERMQMHQHLKLQKRPA